MKSSDMDRGLDTPQLPDRRSTIGSVGDGHNRRVPLAPPRRKRQRRPSSGSLLPFSKRSGQRPLLQTAPPGYKRQRAALAPRLRLDGLRDLAAPDALRRPRAGSPERPLSVSRVSCFSMWPSAKTPGTAASTSVTRDGTGARWPPVASGRRGRIRSLSGRLLKYAANG